MQSTNDSFQSIRAKSEVLETDDVTTAVYIGAGTDTSPIHALRHRHIKRFVFVDSYPKSFESTPDGLDRNWHFLENVVEAMHNEMFFMHPDDIVRMNARPHSDPFVIRFYSKVSDRIVLYYFNTVFGFNKDESLDKYLSQSSTLFIRGFAPHKSILDIMKKPVALKLMCGTHYDIDSSDDPHTVVAELHRTGFDERIASCYVYYPEYKAEECKTMQEAHTTSMRLHSNKMTGMFYLNSK